MSSYRQRETIVYIGLELEETQSWRSGFGRDYRDSRELTPIGDRQ